MTSVGKTMSMLQRMFRDAVEYGEAAFNPFKAVKKPSPGPIREAHPLTPLQWKGSRPVSMAGATG